MREVSASCFRGLLRSAVNGSRRPVSVHKGSKALGWRCVDACSLWFPGSQRPPPCRGRSRGSRALLQPRSLRTGQCPPVPQPAPPRTAPGDPSPSSAPPPPPPAAGVTQPGLLRFPADTLRCGSGSDSYVLALATPHLPPHVWQLGNVLECSLVFLSLCLLSPPFPVLVRSVQTGCLFGEGGGGDGASSWHSGCKLSPEPGCPGAAPVLTAWGGRACSLCTRFLAPPPPRPQGRHVPPKLRSGRRTPVFLL